MKRHHLKTSRLLSSSTKRGGFTLLELTISIGISSILIAGMTSSLLLAVQANNPGDGPFQDVDNASQALGQISRDLTYSSEILTALDETNALEFEVPDQTGDGVNEVIRYQWSGETNEPLERIFNGGTPQPMINDVSVFSINLDTLQQNHFGDAIESDEQTWASQTSSFGYSEYQLNKNTGIGTDFVPNLPADATSWSVTSVNVRCRRTGNVNNKTIYGRIYTANGSREPETLIDETPINEEDLTTSYQWHTVTFQNTTDRSPGERLCITFEAENDASQKARFVILDWSFFSPNTQLLTYVGASKNWQSSNLRDLSIIIRGKYITQNSVEVNFCQSASILLQAGDETSTAIQTVVRPRNIPLVTGD